jgi:hypothetical protein
MITLFEIIVGKLRRTQAKGFLGSSPVLRFLASQESDKVERVDIETLNGEIYTFEPNSICIMHGGVSQLVRYEDVKRVTWISHDRDDRARAKRDGSFDTLIIARTDGTEFTLSGLGQAVFPLLSALRR